MAREPKAKPAASAPIPAPEETAASVLHSLIVPDDLNPRTSFDDGALEELAASIALDGLIQPLLVRPRAPMAGKTEPHHRLVAGERRWRAIRLLIERGQWAADRPVPVTIRDMTNETHLRLALIENLQRRDLNPVDEARAYQRLVDEFGLTTAQIADQVKFTQRFVQKRLQLLECDEKDLAQLVEGRITLEETLRRQASKPKPFNLPADQALIFLEAAHAVALASPGNRDFYAKAPTNYRNPAEGRDEPLYALTNRHWVMSIYSNYEDGIAKVSFQWGARRLMAELTGKEDLEVEAIETALLALRPDTPPTPYATAWLNGPFEPDPEVLAEFERRKADDAAREARAKADRAAAAARTKAINTVGKKLREAVAAPLHEDLAAAVAGAGITLPVAFKNDNIVDAAGRTVATTSYYNTTGVDRPSALRLLALAMNAVAGFPSKPAAEAGQDDTNQPDADQADDVEDAEAA